MFVVHKADVFIRRRRKGSRDTVDGVCWVCRRVQ